jgi:hypothetical protein
MKRRKDLIKYSDGSVLLIDEKYLSKILSGAKTTTIRTNVRIFPPACRITLRSTSSTKSILIAVKGTKVVLFKDLTNEDARKDGFPTKAILKKEMLSHYPGLTDESIVTVIDFEIYGVRSEGQNRS